MKTSIYHNASKLYGEDDNERTFVLPVRKPLAETTGVSNPIVTTPTTPSKSHSTPETYDRPKSYDNVAVLSTPVDKNNNHVLVPPHRADKSKPAQEIM